MRKDAIGFFWQDIPVVKEVKEKVRPVPPERIWEAPDYLPNYDKAVLYKPVEMTVDEIIDASIAGHLLEYDIECYHNYLMAGFYCKALNKYILMEKIPDQGIDFDTRKLKWILQNFRFRTFNGRNYDVVMSEAIIAGFNTEQLKEVSDFIIQKKFDEYGNVIKITPRDVRNKFKLKKLYKNDTGKYKLELDHIDLKEVCPGQASLKAYSARMHTHLMQDLPFHHAAYLNASQIQVLRWYHGNDLKHTDEIGMHLSKECELREVMSREYKIDLRSKSDAQIAEAVLKSELERLTGAEAWGTKVQPGTLYRFKPAPWLKFETENMKWVFDKVCSLNYEVGMNGSIFAPQELEDMLIPIGDAHYQMGIGGLHSTEKKAAHFARDGYKLIDTDVESFYPMLMLLLDIFPHQHPRMREVFWNIVQRRLAAKHAGDKSTSNSLKIVINGTYGKLGEKHSIIYRPDGIIQVCLNGQLSLLMLVERLELAGIRVVSANTDGIVSKPREDQEALFKSIIDQWMKETGLKMEDTRYSMLLSRDVNNYIAIKQEGAVTWDGKTQKEGWKGKGKYINFWHKDNIDHNEQLKHHPSNLVSQEAVIEYLKHGKSIEDYVMRCNDVTKFITVRQVNRGGAYKNGEFLGKTIRYYFATADKDPIIVVDNGHKVGNTLGAKPLMTMDGTLPGDLDRQWYIDEAYKILKDIAYLQ